MAESELEDLFVGRAYRSELELEFDVSLNSALSNGRGPKWSAKLKQMLIKQGKLGSDSEIAKAKGLVARIASGQGLASLNADGTRAIDRLVETLERRLSH
jgi:hypothetical protein